MKIFEALEAGKQLADPVTWKNRQMTMNLLVILLGAITWGLRLAGVNLPLTDEMLSGIAEIIATALGVVNLVLIPATSKKVGLLKE
jgi:hypothetical protein